MLRRITLLAFGALLVCSTGAWAQESPTPPRRLNLLAQQRGVRIAIFDGRLIASAQQDSQAAMNLGKVHQQINIVITDNGTTLDYTSVGPTEQFAVHFQGDGTATIHRQYVADRKEKIPASNSIADSPSDADTIVDYTQLPDQSIKLTLSANGKTRTLEAPTIWHLLLMDPQMCSRQLFPILESLRTDWKFTSATTELKEALLKEAETNRPADRQRWAALVAQLADDQYAVRERAERQLRAAGQAAWSYLQRLDRSELDAEQWRHVCDILASYADEREDAPDRAAARMVEDPLVWLSLLADDSSTTRRAADEQLAAIVGHPIEFDPAASAEIREQQIAALRAKLLPKK